MSRFLFLCEPIFFEQIPSRYQSLFQLFNRLPFRLHFHRVAQFQDEVVVGVLGDGFAVDGVALVFHFLLVGEDVELQALFGRGDDAAVLEHGEGFIDLTRRDVAVITHGILVNLDFAAHISIRQKREAVAIEGELSGQQLERLPHIIQK